MPAPVLTIGGTDPCGAFGLAADLKSFAAAGAYGMGVVTAVTAQNSLGFYGVHAVPVDVVARQLTAVLDDYAPRVVKTGFLGRADVVQVVAECLGRYAPHIELIVDPVLVNGQGQPLFPPAVTAAYQTHLLPLASWLMPNRAEAAVLLGLPAFTSAEELVPALHQLVPTPARVWLKQAVWKPETITDWVSSGGELRPLAAPRLTTANTAGSGDRLSAFLAALLAQNWPPAPAATEAHRLLQHSLATAAGWHLAHGRGPAGL